MKRWLNLEERRVRGSATTRSCWRWEGVRELWISGVHL